MGSGPSHIYSQANTYLKMLSTICIEVLILGGHHICRFQRGLWLDPNETKLTTNISSYESPGPPDDPSSIALGYRLQNTQN